MRVGIVAGPHVAVPPPKYGGTEQVIHNLINGLLELGHEPILIGSGDSEVDCELISIIDKAIFFPRTKREIPKFRLLEAAINIQIKHAIRMLQPRVDIIHSHGFDMTGINFPSVTTLHGPIDLKTVKYYSRRRNLNWISISNNQQEAFTSLNYVGTVYNGENPAKFPIIRRPKDYVCFLGRFDREKNPHLAIELALSLGIKIKVAGKIDFAAEGYFKEEVEKYFDNPLVEYLGELNFKDKVELLKNAKANLHPTGFREPFGLTVLEAAYCGTPTLALARGSMPELIEEGRTGLLVEDFIQGYEQLEQCFAMDRQYIAERSRLLFNYHNMARDYAAVYKKVIQDFKPTKKLFR